MGSVVMDNSIVGRLLFFCLLDSSCTEKNFTHTSEALTLGRIKKREHGIPEERRLFEEPVRQPLLYSVFGCKAYPSKCRKYSDFTPSDGTHTFEVASILFPAADFPCFFIIKEGDVQLSPMIGKTLQLDLEKMFPDPSGKIAGMPVFIADNPRLRHIPCPGPIQKIGDRIV